MNLSAPYLGLTLRNPLIVGASPFADDIDVARRLADAGAAAIVMRSLFEEQIDAEQIALLQHVEGTAATSAEASSFFPDYSEYQLGIDHYLRQLGRLKHSVPIPVIASLNGCRPGGWTDFARRFEAAGADAIELNVYQVATDPTRAGDEIEAETLQMVSDVASSVRVPVSVKLSPFYTSPAHFVASLEAQGAAGVVLFNRFYQPDLDVEDLEVCPTLRLSEQGELLLRLRWLAILSPHVGTSLAASGGIHQATDVVKCLLAGAHAVQVVSVLLRHGPEVLSALLAGVEAWLREHGYESVSQLRGAMNMRRCPDPAAFERANYIRILQSWRV